MAQRFTFSGNRLVQLGRRRALFCDPELLEDKEEDRKCTNRFVFLQRVTDQKELPDGDAYGLKYVDMQESNSTSPRVLVRVAPYIDRHVVTPGTIHHTHNPLIQENLRGTVENEENNFAPLRVMWSDCWRVCAAWWWVSTDIVENREARHEGAGELSITMVQAIVKNDSANFDEMHVDARHEYGPNVAQRLSFSLLRRCSGL